MFKNSSILTTSSSSDYELLDSGEGEKLERFGAYILSRPDPQALWPKKLSPIEWKSAQAIFSRDAAGADWQFKGDVPKKWQIDFGGLKMWIKPTAFKHTGLFPEQAVNWEWLRNTIQQFNNSELKDSVQNNNRTSAVSVESDTVSTFSNKNEEAASESRGHGGVEILNLFGYTGGASLACAQAGASVVHIDSSKSAVAWARENAEASGLAGKPIRWIIEDARIFVERELKRGRKYDGIIMDPPAFGHGPSSELWKIEEHFLPLIEQCKLLLKGRPLFFLINGYSAGYSGIAYRNNLLSLVDKYGGSIVTGELTIEEGKIERLKDGNIEQKQTDEGRLLPAGIFVRWSVGNSS